jgi:SpoVK/Ycf46/Vps4 family AAA+-type ATPase
MVVKRISDINVEKRGLFTAIYGNVTGSEYFIDSCLKKYNLWQQLYLYLKQEGYIVLFYDAVNNVHSYSQADMVEFLGLEKIKAIPTTKYVATHIRSPFRQARINEANNKTVNNLPDESVHQSIQKYSIVSEENLVYRTSKTTGELDDLKRLFYARQKKPIAYVIKNPENWTTSEAVRYETFFKELEDEYDRSKLSGKIFLIYNYDNASSLLYEGFEKKNSQGIFFFADSFKVRFVDSTENSNPKLKQENTYYLSLPDKEEIKNLINRKRMEESINVFYPVSIEKIVIRLAQERKPLCMLEKINLSDFIKKIDSISAWDKLKSLKGIDDIIQTLERRVKSMKKSIQTNSQNRDRPHMVFKGPPGTGKTTIARLFADILREEGILEIGHLVEAKVGDLISQHVGETRIKTQKKCDEAKGGILFIDEAYGLLDNHGNGFGKDAIEVLIQFMENNTDSLVIIAGYTNEIEELITKGNQGFARRFVPSNHITFKDYEPDTLIEIAKAKLKDYSITLEAEKMINNILREKHRRKTQEWGNAGEVENLIQEIFDEYNNTDDTVLDVQHIPAKYQKMINPQDVESSKSEGLLALNSLIGLSEMKETLCTILEQIKFDKERAEITGIAYNKPDLNFVFQGNPGTGKTTVARLLGKVLHEFGLLNTSDVVECNRKDLVAGYMGQTATKVEEVFKKALGKVLFIDEAYSLVNSDTDSYGKETVDTIVPLLTNSEYQGKFAFVIAGYTQKINDFLETNNGLRSRFTHYVHFEDYTNEELWQIYLLIARQNGYKLQNEEECKTRAMQWLNAQTRDEQFGNARLIEKNLFPITKNGLINRARGTVQKTVETYTTIIPDDFPSSSGVINTTRFVNPTKEVPLSFNLYKPLPSVVTNIHDIIKQSVGIVKTDYGFGTGFLITIDGYILTAYHVIARSQRFQVGFYANTVTYEAKLVWVKEQIDMALLKVDLVKQIFTPFELASRDEPIVQQLTEVYLAGYPLGNTLAQTPTITEDKIANCQQQVKVSETVCFNAIYTYNNATNGYSGGPLIRKSDLKVIGVLHGGLPDNGNINLSTDIKQLYLQEELLIS